MRVFFLLGVILGLTGCPSTVSQINSLPATSPLSQPVLFNRPGLLLHEASGFAFPERYGNFQRVTAYRYDSAGLNVGIGYNDRRPQCVIVATFYVYPTPRMSFIGASPDVVSSIEQGWIDEEFGRSKAEVEQLHPAMRSPLVRSASTPVTGAFLRGSSFSFRESGNVSELLLFVYDLRWFLKYRFTYPESCKAEADSRIEAVISQLPWAAP